MWGLGGGGEIIISLKKRKKKSTPVTKLGVKVFIADKNSKKIGKLQGQGGAAYGPREAIPSHARTNLDGNWKLHPLIFLGLFENVLYNKAAEIHPLLLTYCLSDNDTLSHLIQDATK